MPGGVPGQYGGAAVWAVATAVLFLGLGWGAWEGLEHGQPDAGE